VSGTTAFIASRAAPTVTVRGATPAARAIGRGLTASALAHALVFVAVIVAARGEPRGVAPPVYRVALVSAPAGTSATSAATAPPRPGVNPGPATRASANPVRAKAALSAPHPTPTAPVAAPRHAPPPVTHAPAAHSAAVTPARPMPSAKPAPPPARTPPRTAPSVAKPVRSSEARASRPAAVASAPKAPAVAASDPAHAAAKRTGTAGGAAARPTSEHPAERGGGTGTATARGHDVADVRVVGLAFPYPGYLDNLVRQVRLRFEPTQARAGLHADLTFIVARDGSISGLRVVRSSGNYAFDLEAQGAVEAAGSARAFGPLPDGFHGTTLPVTFSFDPRPTP